MRYLIAQGPSYYGVNIRLVSEDDAAILQRSFEPVDVGPTSAAHGVGGFVLMKQTEDGTMLLLVDAPTPGYPDEAVKSFGFDTGWWEEGERAIEEVLK